VEVGPKSMFTFLVGGHYLSSLFLFLVGRHYLSSLFLFVLCGRLVVNNVGQHYFLLVSIMPIICVKFEHTNIVSLLKVSIQ